MILGPDTPPRGEVVDGDPLTQSQIAATLSALMGHNYNAQQPRAGQPIPGAIAKGATP